MLGVGLGQIANVLVKFESRNLQMDPNQCSRLRHMRGTCTRCMDNCPQHAISFDETLHVDVDKCNDCGICAGVCPTGALEATHWTDAELIHRVEECRSAESLAFACPKAFRGLDERVVSVSCIGRLDESVLIAAVTHGIHEVLLADGPCQSCANAVGRKAAAQTVAESNELLQAFGIPPIISIVPEIPFAEPASDESFTAPQALSRRAFFNSFLRETKTATALTVSAVLEKEPEKKTERVKGDLPQRLSTKRQLLLEMLPRLGQLRNPVLAGENGSWGTCHIKESCTACQMCAFFCPTGALTKVVQDGKPALVFRVSHCTNCRLCLEICYWQSLDLLPTVNLEKVIADAKETLAFDAETVALLSPEEKSQRLIKSFFGI